MAAGIRTSPRRLGAASSRPRGIAAAAAMGDALGVAFGAAAALRRKKPLHPRGVVLPARLEHSGAATPWGVSWLDERGTDDGFVRFSRAIGLPQGWPDVLGLALRFSDAGRSHDLLLATTGMARGARHLLLPRVHSRSASYTSNFAYVTPRGHAVLAATPGREPGTFTMLVAPVFGPWQPFATLRVGDDPMNGEYDEAGLDPVRNPLPGLELAPLLAALRAPAYAAAQRMRQDGRGPDMRRTRRPHG